VESIGYSSQSRTLTITAGAILVEDFQLGIVAIELDEIVATGYAQQTRRQTSSAISSVQSTAREGTVVASLDAALAGKAPGVQIVQNAGNPGNAVTVRVRGSASISASSQTLYVVDGVPPFREGFGQLGFGGQDINAITGLNASEPWAPVRNPDGSFNFDGSYSNPAAVGALNNVNARTLRSFGNVSATYGATSWLRGTARAGFDLQSLRGFRYDSPEVLLTYAAGVDGISRMGNSRGQRSVLEGFLTTSQHIGLHDLSMPAGASLEFNTRETSFPRGESFTSTELHWPANVARPVSVHGTTRNPTAVDRMIVGSPHLDYIGGFRNSLSYGPFDLTAFVELSQGVEVYNAMRRFADDGGYYQDNKSADVLNYWTPENPKAPNPRPSYYGRATEPP
jgi:hypothetical protein